MEKDKLYRLLSNLPFIKDHNSDAFFNFLDLLEGNNISDSDGFSKVFVNFMSTIPKEELEDFKFLIKTFFKFLDFAELTTDSIKVPLFSYLLSNQLLDESELDNPTSLSLAIEKLPKDFFRSLKAVINYDDQFLEIAEYSFSEKKPLVGIALFAITIEHKINDFYRDILIFKNLDHDEITQLLRTANIHVKLGWLLKLTTAQSFDPNLKNSLKRLFDFRNSIVHYKAIPIPIDDLGIKNEQEILLNEFTIERLQGIVKELDHFFNKIRKIEIPNFEKAIALADLVFKPKEF